MIDQSTYCSLSTSAWDDRNKKMCCFAQLPKFKDHKQMHQDNKVKTLVNDLTTGVRNSICDVCWKAEDSGSFSMRQQSLTNEGSPKSQTYIDNEASEKKLKYLIVDTGTQCNFACRTCGPWSSTGHIKEWKEKNGETWNNVAIDYNKLLEQDLSNVKNVELLGGEPVVNLEHLQIVDLIKQNNPYWLTYTTNGSVKLRKEILDRFNEFIAVNICLSIDAIGKPFEYIRTLGKWDKVNGNIDHLVTQKQNYKNLSINCHVTLSALNVLYLNELVDWCESKRIPYDFTYCSFPEEYSFDIFTNDQKQNILTILNKDTRSSVAIKYLKESTYKKESRDKFDKSVAFTKKFRNLDAKEYIPKLFDIIV